MQSEFVGFCSSAGIGTTTRTRVCGIGTGTIRIERERERRRSYWLHGKSFKGLHIAATTRSKIADKECGLVGRKH